MSSAVERRKQYSKREQLALARARMAPMRPEWVYQRRGWNTFTREDIEVPDLLEHPPLGEEARLSDPRLPYHAHLRMVQTEPLDVALLDAFIACGVNIERREGILDRVIDGMKGTGKSLLLRAIGRDVQREIEDKVLAQTPPPGGSGADQAAHTGVDQQIPVVHILAPADTDSKVDWVWEIACFLGLNPEPRDEDELIRWRTYPDLTRSVNFVLERGLTRLLLVDDIQRVAPDQLAPVLHYFDYLRNRLGITTIFCGTGASDIVREARARADHYEVVVGQHARRAGSPSRAAGKEHETVHGMLPVTWLDPIPFHGEETDTWLSALAGFEKDLALHHLSDKALRNHAVYLHRRTGGYFLQLSQLVSQAATHAIRTGTEDITLTELDAVNLG